MIKKINPDLVTHITITDFEDTGAVWRDTIPEKRWFFGLFLAEPRKEAGWFDPFWDEYVVYKNTTKVDGKLLFNPFLSIYVGKEKIFGKHYKTVEEIEEICSKNFPNVSVELK